MISLNKRQSGFTIVELLIVIVVIGILATLVIVTFTGIQQKARDSQRQTDVNALNSQLEAFYAQNSYYPTLADLNSSSWVSTNMKGLDPESLIAPNGSANSLTAGTGASVTATDHYYYDTTGCDNTAASSSSNACTAYTLSAKLENGSTPFVKKSNT